MTQYDPNSLFGHGIRISELEKKVDWINERLGLLKTANEAMTKEIAELRDREISRGKRINTNEIQINELKEQVDAKDGDATFIKEVCNTIKETERNLINDGDSKGKCDTCIDEHVSRSENPNRLCDDCGPSYSNWRPKSSELLWEEAHDILKKLNKSMEKEPKNDGEKSPIYSPNLTDIVPETAPSKPWRFLDIPRDLQKLIENALISEFLKDLVHHYDYDYEDHEKMEKLIEKWEKRLKD